MSRSILESPYDSQWSVLTGRWLDVMSLNAEAQVYSPLEALRRADGIRCITLSSPLDLFAAYRFLLTLLYWKADAAGGVTRVREMLLRSDVPGSVLDAIETETDRFRMFDDVSPFLQDSSTKSKTKDLKSAGSLFAELASGTNIAHFNHGDDKRMHLCVRCATLGMLRVVPWSQAGGSGKTPTIHGAPPIMVVASGKNLAETLGLNLTSFSNKAGTPRWSGHFVPTDKNSVVPYLEALTWNPRRIHLRSAESVRVCWLCGDTETVGVGLIVYMKNKATKKPPHRPFQWHDPAAFYTVKTPHTTIKSRDELRAARGSDLPLPLNDEVTTKPSVVESNSEHRGWHIVIPCTNPAHNKTYDHRQIELADLSTGVVEGGVTPAVRARGTAGFDGWTEPRAIDTDGCSKFVCAASRLLTIRDWGVLAGAAYHEMHEAPSAFDIFSGLFWSLRGRVSGLPSRRVGWLVLKLMATVPARARVAQAHALFCPLRHLPKRQLNPHSEGQARQSPYPVSLPRGRQLERELRDALKRNQRRRVPEPVDWPGLCQRLDHLLD